MVNGDRSNPTADQLLLWLMEFGSDWVHENKVRDTWADKDLHWEILRDKGWIDIEDDYGYYLMKLTPKSLAFVQESGHDNR